MAQYVPCGRAAEFPRGINRRITKREYEKVQQHLFNLGLDGYVQERTSAQKGFIPPFDLEGLPPLGARTHEKIWLLLEGTDGMEKTTFRTPRAGANAGPGEKDGWVCPVIRRLRKYVAECDFPRSVGRGLRHCGALVILLVQGQHNALTVVSVSVYRKHHRSSVYGIHAVPCIGSGAC